MGLFKKRASTPKEDEPQESSSYDALDPAPATVVSKSSLAAQPISTPALPISFDRDNAVLPEPYFLDDDGRLCGVDVKGESFPITEAPIWPVSIMRTHQGDGWCLQVCHHDADNKPHTLTFPMSEIVMGKAAIVGRLADAGLPILPGRANDLLSFIQRCKPDERVILTSQGGWLGTDHKVFVLPHTIVGDTGREKVVFQQEHNSPTFESMRSSGTLEEWQAGIAAVVRLFPLAMFVLMAGFVGPLLKIIRLDGGGFHFFGPSSRGKSTLLQIIASIWGKGSDPGRDAKSFVQRWLQTVNALEAIAACHSDTAICLDELGTFNGDLGHTIYMLAGGSGKSVMDSHRRLKTTRQWSGNILSSGEKTVRDAIEESGRNAKAGQLIRVIDIPAGDAFPSADGQNMGEIVNALKERSATTCGTAGPEFVGKLILSLRNAPDQVLDDLRAEFEATVKALTPEGATPEQGRAIRRFASVEVAGKTAARFGVLPYSDAEIRACVLNVRDRYLSYSTNVPDSQRGILQLQSFLIRNHTSFPSIADSEAKVSNAKGFSSGKGFFLLNDEQLAVASGIGMSGVIELAKTLKEQGYLATHEAGRLKTKHRVVSAGDKHLRFYTIKGSLLEADLNGEDTIVTRTESKQQIEPIVQPSPATFTDMTQDDEDLEDTVEPQSKRPWPFKNNSQDETEGLETSENPESSPEVETTEEVVDGEQPVALSEPAISNGRKRLKGSGLVESSENGESASEEEDSNGESESEPPKRSSGLFSRRSAPIEFDDDDE